MGKSYQKKFGLNSFENHVTGNYESPCSTDSMFTQEEEGFLNDFFKLTGAEGQNRTADTGIFSPLLYRLSYLGAWF